MRPRRRDRLRARGRPLRRRADGGDARAPRAGRAGRLERRADRARAPAAEHHRPVGARRAAAGRLRPRPDDRLQRLHLQLQSAARRAGGRRPPLLLDLRLRGDREGVRRVGAGLRRALRGHVRVRRRRARQRPPDARARPPRDQAALPRGGRRRAALRLDAARPAGRRRGRHDARPGRAPPLPLVACGRAGAAHDPEGRPQAAAGDRDDGRARRQPLADALLGSAVRAPDRARRDGRARVERGGARGAARRGAAADGRRRSRRRAAVRRARLVADRRAAGG